MNTWLVANGDLVLRRWRVPDPLRSSQNTAGPWHSLAYPIGTDRFHPRYGSVFGQYIGQPVGPLTQSLLQSEINRIIKNYQTVQLNRMNQAILQGYATVYALDDLVQAIQSISVTQNFDSFTIKATLITMSGTTVNISSSVSSSGPTAG